MLKNTFEEEEKIRLREIAESLRDGSTVPRQDVIFLLMVIKKLEIRITSLNKAFENYVRR